jgi:polar amino acid transport system substrate-binding protein
MIWLLDRTPRAREGKAQGHNLGGMIVSIRAIAIGLVAAALVATGLLATGAAQTRDWKEIRIGTEGAYAPFNHFDANKNLIGFDIDIAKALCDKMRAKCTFVAQDWDGILPALLANKYDAIVASMSMTDERKKVVDFTNRYYNSPVSFVTRKGAGIADTSPAAMSGKTVGAQGASVHSNFLEDKYSKTAKLKFYRTLDEANLDLLAGRVDYVLGDKFALYEWLQGDGKEFEIVGPDYTDAKYFGEGIGIALRKQDKDLRDRFNKALQEIRADGTYEKINKKYFPFSIY